MCSRTSITVFLAVACSSCTFAPPIRSVHGGAPGRVSAREVEVGAAANLYPGVRWERETSTPWLSPALSYGIVDTIAIEAAADVTTFWRMGSLGLRLTPLQKKDKLRRFSYDFEIGGGAGVGGALYCEDDTNDCKGNYKEDKRDSMERIAAGGYAGVGFGYRWSWFGVFLRGQYQLTGATNVPLTQWLSFAAGPQFTIFDGVYIYAAGGMWGWVNQMDDGHDGLAEIGTSVVF
ncbi:MAG: hypothetical protein PHU25_14945 [Deltaproteobacteria bacterium]|nr:hypothetical protein [Deltaproteobacteria bacterium]